MSMRTNMLFAAMATVLALAGCVKNPFEESASRDIHFGAYAPKSSLTKAVYSYHQETVDTDLWERIDWEDGDLIEIRCDQVSSDPKYFDYDITFKENETLKSFATAAPHGAEHGLQWGSGTHTFFSMYPSKNTVGAQSGIELELTGGTTARATADLPADQSVSSPISVTLDNSSTTQYYGNMKLAYMTAAQEAILGSDVTLSFKPMVTTFFVNVVNTTGAAMTLRKVELTSESSALTGKFRLTMDKNNTRKGTYEYWNGESWVDGLHHEGRNNIYAAFPDGISIPASGDITVALFALPHEITKMTLTVTSDETGAISLPLKNNDEFLVFAAEKKYNLNNISVPGVTYSLDVDPVTISYDYTGAYTPDDQEFTVTSSKNIGGTIRDVPWKTQVWVDDDGDGVQDEEEWRDLADEVGPTGAFPWLSNFPTNSLATPDADADDNTTTSTYQKAAGAQDVVSHDEVLRNGVVYENDGVTEHVHNTAATAIDLSYYDFVHRKMDTKRYTANTYIISAPGYYKIPLVYGNAIENGERVAASYSGRPALLGHLDEFVCPYPNSAGTESSIHLSSTRPWLNARRSAQAEVYWEKYSYWDEGSGQMVTTHKKHDSGSLTIPSPIDNISITTGTGDERFIVFEVKKDYMHPGNVLLASLDQHNNVQWSWQIWITDQDMAPIPVYNGTSEYQVMPVNLGWTDLSRGLRYDAREAVLRFASTEKAGLHSEHTLTVQQTPTVFTSTTGWSTFYQWGRKDPMTESITTSKDNDNYLHVAVKHPCEIMYDKSSYWGQRYYDWTINNYNNLWDSKNTSYDPSGDLPNHKTVYDPSPRRYCVPPDATWDGFTSGYTATAEGIYFPTGVGDNTIFFPHAGLLNYTSGTHSAGNDIENGYWTYHPYDGVEKRASYCLLTIYNNASHEAKVRTKVYTDWNGEYMSRAYGFSVRPVAFDASESPSDGTKSTVFIFQEMWGDGSTVEGFNANNLNGFSTNTPSEAETAYQNDITISFVSERDIDNKKIKYVNDGGDYSIVLPDSYDGIFADNYNRFTISTSNPKMHIVQIILTYTQKGVDIVTDSPTFDNVDGIWVDTVTASYNPATQKWSGGKDSVQFTMNAGTGDPWKVSAITVNYYVDN